MPKLFLALAFVCAFVGNASAATATPQFKGKFIQGGMVIGRVPVASRVYLNDKEVKVSSGGVFVLGFGRDQKPKAALKVVHADGSLYKQTLAVQQREYDIQRIDGLPPKKVTPPESVLKRIREESAAIKKARKRNDDRLDFTETFKWPSKGRISGVYGSQRVLNGQPRRPHFGIDIAAPTGTPVVAPASGVVTFAHQDMYFSGKTLVIDHGHGVSSTFLHLHSIDVKEGDYVMQGDPIATVGSTGRSTGPHVDWRMNWLDQRIDPQFLVSPKPEPLQ